MIFILFNRERNNKIWEIITGHLNMPMLENLGFAFSGGSLFSMKYGEYRESLDIDFMCSNTSKQIVDSLNPIDIFISSLSPYNTTRNKQGHCSFSVDYKEENFKIELFSIYVEPFDTDIFNGILATSPSFSIMYKLLAHAYRGNEISANDRFRYRDMIDLIILYKHHQNLFDIAWNKTINMNKQIVVRLIDGTIKSLEQFNLDKALDIFNIVDELKNDFRPNYEELTYKLYNLINHTNVN